MKTDLTQLNRLEEYLKGHGIPYERIDREIPDDESWWLHKYSERHQICVPVEKGDERLLDAICQPGSYGYEFGLLEIMGTLVSQKQPNGDSVIGHLTADDVISLIEGRG